MIARLRKEMDEEHPDIDASLKEKVARTEERDTSFSREAQNEKLIREQSIRSGMMALLKSVFSGHRSKCAFDYVFSKRFVLYEGKKGTQDKNEAALITSMNETQLMARLGTLAKEYPQMIKISVGHVIEVNSDLLLNIQ